MFARKKLIPLTVRQLIFGIENTLSGLNRQLGVVEGSFAGALSKGRDNAEPILQSTELVSGLMYCLRSNDPDKKWLNAGQLDTLLDGSRMEAAFLGLMQQRLSQTKQIGLLSPTALTDLVRLTIKDLDLLAGPDLPDSLQVKDSLAFFRKAAFAVNTLNRILELPLVSAGQGRAGFTPLKNHWPKLEQVPEISERVLHFIYYLNIKDHGKAISALIRVFASLNLNMAETAVPAGKKDNNKRQSAILYLQKYGDFIAGLLDARVARDVEELLKQISDPPGSSRIKRKSPLTVSLNAYLGGTFGGERWTGNALPSGETMWALAPTMPVGITISHLFGKNKCSISAFISFLDVGALLTYQPESSQSVESDFNFKNMFKPGLQLHWNIKKSPFYLGAGWQYGPQFVQVNNEKKIVKANRYFIGFGVDVPIRTLYQR